jgi:ubiquinone/menaquinone biosynthesis C-methylase UbiE
MEYVDKNIIKNFYDKKNENWPSDNSWYDYTQTTIKKYIHRHIPNGDSVILNAGSGGNTYGLVSKNIFHVDISDSKIKNLKNAVVSSVENLPFENGMFDNVICVGSVINYCDALQTISEMARVIKKSGRFILEFESSGGFEYAGMDAYKKDAAVVTLSYMGESHPQWLYSFRYIKKILFNCGFSLKNVKPFHILSAIHLRKTGNENKAGKFANYDCLFQFMPFFRKKADNIILLCQRQ